MVKLVLCLILFVAGAICKDSSEDVLTDLINELPVDPEIQNNTRIVPLNSMF